MPDGGAVPDRWVVETHAPLPNSAVYWMLLTPVSVLFPRSKLELMLPGSRPRRRVGRRRLTEREASELDEDIQPRHSHHQGCSARLQIRPGTMRARLDWNCRNYWKSPWPKVQTTPYSVAARVDRQRHTVAGNKVVGKTIVPTKTDVPARCAMRASLKVVSVRR
jgi:hypothetical protein